MHNKQKLIFYFLFPLLFLFCSYSLALAKNQDKMSIQKIEKNNEELNSIKKRLDTIENKTGQSYFEQRLNLSESIIKSQDAYINNISQIFEIIIVVLPIIGGLVGYFFFYKPQRDLSNEIDKLKEDLLQDFNKKLDKGIDDFITKKYSNETKENLKNLFENDSFVRTNSFNYFANTQNRKLSDSQIENLYLNLKVAEANEELHNTRSMAENILSFQKHNLAEKYFRDSLENEITKNKSYRNIIKYFKSSGFKDYKDILIKRIKQSLNPFMAYQITLAEFYNDNENAAILLNDIELNNLLNENELKTLFHRFRTNINFPGTYLYSKIILFPCPCCGYKTFTHPPLSLHEDCPVCKWFHNRNYETSPDYKDQNNHNLSLKEAQKNYLANGAISDILLNIVISPKNRFERENNWQPIDVNI